MTKEEIEREQINERLAKVRDALKKKKDKLSEEEYQTVKVIFHGVPQLDSLPKSLWIPLSQLFVLKEIPKGSKLVSREDSQYLCCIVLSGKFASVSLEAQFAAQEGEPSSGQVELLPGSACANFEALGDKRWRPADVIGIEEMSTAAVFTADSLGKLMNKEMSNTQFKALLDFLTRSIPKFDQLSGHFKERLCRFFKETIFLPGKEIVPEGTLPTSAYLIREGVCVVMSRQNPLFHPSRQKCQVPETTKTPTNPSAKSIMPQQSPAKTMRGYMSLSTNTYQLRTVAEREWFGEEILLAEEMPNLKFEYSVIARTKVVALEITKENLRKFPTDLLDWFKKNARNKTTWHNERKMELADSITKIYHMDPLTNFLDEAFEQVIKKFPQATPQLTSQLHKHNFLSEEDDDLVLVEEQLKEVSAKSKMRPRSGVMPTFNHLRTLMNTKKLAAMPQDRPLTAAQSVARLPQFREKEVHTAGFGYRSVVQLHQNLLTKKGGRTGQRLYEDLMANYTTQQKVYLESASTFKMTYDNKISFPTAPHKQRTKKVMQTEREKHEDSGIEKMRVGIESQYDTFKVGIRDVKAIDSEASKRPPSPNPTRVWAAKNKVDIARRNKEIRIKVMASQQAAQPAS